MGIVNTLPAIPGTRVSVTRARFELRLLWLKLETAQTEIEFADECLANGWMVPDAALDILEEVAGDLAEELPACG